MNEQEALTRMVAPGTPRPGKYRQGVIQVWLTRACDKACYGCTQGSNLAGSPGMMTPIQFEQAILSLRNYWGVVGVFGGNPAISPHFEECCAILRKHIPFEQRGLWCNNPLGKGKIMQETFCPQISNLNVHLDRKAYEEFKRDWPECNPVGLTSDSRHSPPYVAIEDVVDDEGKRWELISDCDINKHWSAMIGVFRGELRAWFCEVAGAQAMLHQHEPDYPDTGIDPTSNHFPTLRGTRLITGIQWWQLPMVSFASQVRHHCHSCGVPLRGHGELAQARDGTEQVSATHEGIYRTKQPGRTVEVVTHLVQLGRRLERMTDYLGNSRR